MRVNLLGPLEVRDDAGEPIEVAGGRLRALLVRLALDAGRVVSTETLIDDLWGEDPPAGATNALQSLVSRLRKAGVEVEAKPAGYAIAAEVDAHEFERLASADPAAAECLWRGPALADVLDAPFAPSVATRLDDLRLAAAEHRDPSLAELERLTAEHPMREGLHALLIKALAQQGRQADALAAYERLRGTLETELGIDPSPELAELHLAILRQETPRGGRGNVTTPLTSFVGREQELRRLEKLLGDGRLVTVIGPGGAGKTRLATELAIRISDQIPDGAWMVQLARVTEPLGLVQSVLTAFGFRERGLSGRPDVAIGLGDATTRLTDQLARQDLLLILDNCEHVVAAAAELAERLLLGCPGLQIVATSRTPLGIPGEALAPIPPLEVDPAVTLFTDRARAVRPDFAVTDANVQAVDEICRRLDGMPLAIELAAARVRALAPAQIAERLDDRFRLLTGGSRTALPRHQTLRAVVDWSWDLLSDPERAVLRRLSLFPGGATLDAAEQICAGGELATGDVLDALGGLVDKSLVEADLVPATRYRMLETVRAYGLERLDEAGETETTNEALATYFLELAETTDPLLRTADQLVHLEVLGADHDNLIAALRWAIDVQRAETANRLAVGLLWYWFLRGNRTESFAWMREAATVPGEIPDHVHAITLTFYALAEEMDGRTENSRSAVVAALECVRRVRDRSRHPVLSMLEPVVAVFTADVATARVKLTKALELPDRWSHGLALMFRSHLEENAGNIEAAEADARASLEVFRELGERWGISGALRTLANHRSLDGDHAAAVAAYEEAIEHLRALGSTEDLHELGSQLGLERWRAGDRKAGEAELNAVLAIAERLGQPAAAMWVRLGMAEISADQGDLGRAHEYIDRALVDLTSTNFGSRQAEAYLVTMQGLLFIVEGDADAARDRLRYGVGLALAVKDIPALAVGVHCMAGLAMLEGDAERAARLTGLTAVLRGRPLRGIPLLVDVADHARAALGDAAYDAALAQGTALSRDDAIAFVADWQA